MELVSVTGRGSGVVVPGDEIVTACHVAIQAPLAVWDPSGAFRGVAVNPRCTPGYVPDPTSLTPDVARLEVRWQGTPPPAASLRSARFGIVVAVEGVVRRGMSGGAVMDSQEQLVGVVSRGEQNGRWIWVEQLTMPLTIHGYSGGVCTTLRAIGMEQ